ncbi:MAG: tRNA lysidine(34) synthetase TilS [Alphaproteobacteria bacterium]|nr:tRNA lysidine(34) synthetase TilS [Alphaproteobacteria bacterium]
MLSTVASRPLGPAEFAARVERLAFFEIEPFVAVAVSGGPDSLALGILADQWARQRGGHVCALSVDHRLRPESEAEIRKLAQWLAARSIRHEILAWHGPKPATGLQEAARSARYQLLTEWCRAQGCLHLMTGHHREDQVETYLLRQSAGSGLDGLAGMPAVRELAGCRILRPLLDVPKARLVATLAAASQEFITDPSNRDPTFARARLRQGTTDVDLDAALGELHKLGHDRIAREDGCHALLAHAAALHPAGFAVLDPEVLLSAPPELAQRALSKLVFALGGGLYPPRRRSIARLLLMLAGATPVGGVLGGYRFVAWRERVLVLRELAAAAPAVRLAPNDVILWDQRFEASLASAGRPLALGYLGRDGVAELHRQSPGFKHRGLPPLIYTVLPGFWDETSLVAVPFLGYSREEGMAIPQLAFRPVNCLTHASFAVV